MKADYWLICLFVQKSAVVLSTVHALYCQLCIWQGIYKLPRLRWGVVWKTEHGLRVVVSKVCTLKGVTYLIVYKTIDNGVGGGQLIQQVNDEGITTLAQSIKS